MKKNKLITLLSVIMMACLLSGCAAKTEATAVNETIQETAAETKEAEAETETSAQIANPVKRVDESEFKVSFSQPFMIPEGMKNVRYAIIDKNLGEINFSDDNNEYTLRLQKTDSLTDISGLYYTWNADEKDTLGSFEATNSRYIGQGETIDRFAWYNPEFKTTYCLIAKGSDLNGFDIKAIAEQIAGVGGARTAMQAVDNPALLHPTIINVYEGGQEQDNRMAYTLTYSDINLPENEKKAYPNLDTAILEDLDNYMYQHSLEALEHIKTAYRPELQNEENFDGLKVDIKAQVYRADENFFSVRVDRNYDYHEGQHGEYVTDGFTYSTQTGSVLAPADIFTEKGAMLEALKKELKKKTDADYFNLDEDLNMYSFETSYLSGSIAFNILVTNDGIIFIFNPYEIAPYASGQIEVMLPYAEYADIIKPEIRKVPASYVTPLKPYVATSAGGHKITLNPQYSQYNDIEKINLDIDGTVTSFDTRTYHIDAYIAKEGDATYLYAFEDSDDDVTFYQKFAVKDGKAEEVENKKYKRVYDEVNVEARPILNLNCYARGHRDICFCDPAILPYGIK